MNITRGRCHDCRRAFEWKAGKSRQLVKMRCPKCAGPLDRTSHQYQGNFRPIPSETAEFIAAGVFDDFGIGAWAR